MAEAGFLGFDWSSLFSLLLGALVKGVNDWLAQRRAEQAREDKGRAEAERDGAEKIGEIAAEQTKRAVNPPDDATLIDRLNKGTG